MLDAGASSSFTVLPRPTVLVGVGFLLAGISDDDSYLLRVMISQNGIGAAQLSRKCPQLLQRVVTAPG
ncbi:hypothetical protein D3C71_1621510 [compost metagenome]